MIEGGTGDLILVPGLARPAPTCSAVVRTGGDGQPYYQPGGNGGAARQGAVELVGARPRVDATSSGFAGPTTSNAPVGGWNRTDLICAGDQITCYLNGRIVNAADHLSVTSGRVLLQSEGAEILFRKFEVRGLPEKPR